MNSRFLRLLQLSLGAMDFITINVVFFTTHFLFRGQSLIEENTGYIYFDIFLNLAWLIVALIVNIYHERNILSFEQFTKISMHAYVYFLLLVVVYLFFFRILILSRIFILVILTSVSIALLINRFIYLIIYYYFKKHNFLVNKVVVIGYNNLSKKLVRYLEEEGINKEIIGFCEEYENINELSNYPILSNINNSFEVCKTHGITEIYSTIAPEQNNSLYELIQNADQNCIRFRIVPDMAFFFKRKMHIDYLKEIPVISLRKEPLEDLGNRIKKRVIDIAISLFVVVFILSWLIPIVGLIIRLGSKGPIFFKQLRTGKDNKSFYCLKFRSMKVNAKANLMQASKNDERVTWIGRILRSTSLDEYPQFLNVLKGDMSVVGPRPHMLKHTDEYAQLIGQYMIRQFLKPGITGWAQVNGFRGETKTVLQMQQRVEFDLWYMENWSLWVDLKILFLTVFNMVRGEKNVY